MSELPCSEVEQSSVGAHFAAAEKSAIERTHMSGHIVADADEQQLKSGVDRNAEGR